jgi:hypothetical protein
VPKQSRLDIVDTAKLGVLAGTAGGLAEILWISFYAVLADADAAQVARGVSASFGAGTLAESVLAGIVIHMLLAVVLGIVLAFAWCALRARLQDAPVVVNEYTFVFAALTTVWFVNFFVVLPLISPAFVELLPYQVSLSSKLLFGWAAAMALRWAPSAATCKSPAALSVFLTWIKKDLRQL